MNIDRRTALARMLALTGTVLVGAEYFLTGSARADKETAADFTADEQTLLDEIGDTIIPPTDTPGAKATGIGAFMIRMVRDCYDDRTQAAFRAGLVQIETACRAKFGRTFVEAGPGERLALLNDLDREQRIHSSRKPADGPPHYFSLMKQLTLLGYFSSEIGCTQALRYVETPGAYHGDVPYRKGERAWFNPAERFG